MAQTIALALLQLSHLLGGGFATQRGNAEALSLGELLEANLLCFGRRFLFDCHICD